MTTKEYLSQIRRLNRDIRRLEERIAEYRELMLSSSRQAADGTNTTGAAGSIDGSALENKVVKFSDKINELTALKEKKTDIKTRIELQIMSLDDVRYVDVLRLRYIDCLQWDEIAEYMGYSKDWIWHIHGDALRKFDKEYRKSIDI